MVAEGPSRWVSAIRVLASGFQFTAPVTVRLDVDALDGEVGVGHSGVVRACVADAADAEDESVTKHGGSLL